MNWFHEKSEWQKNPEISTLWTKASKYNIDEQRRDRKWIFQIQGVNHFKPRPKAKAWEMIYPEDLENPFQIEPMFVNDILSKCTIWTKISWNWFPAIRKYYT